MDGEVNLPDFMLEKCLHSIGQTLLINKAYISEVWKDLEPKV